MPKINFEQFDLDYEPLFEPNRARRINKFKKEKEETKPRKTEKPKR